MKFKKIDVVLVVAILIIATVFFYKLGYLESYQPEKGLVDEDTEISPEPETPEPPESFTSFFPLIKRERTVIEPVDEGAHFSKLFINREWWIFTAFFDGKNSELENWSITIGFAHLAYGDILGRLKPDLFFVSLHDDNGQSYGGFVNEKRGALDARKSTLNIKFGDSWAEGQLPFWHVHAEDGDIDKNHQIVVDLDYEAISPIRNRLMRNIEKSHIEQYLVPGCIVQGNILLDGKEYVVNGTGMHEHSWTPFYMHKGVVPPRLNGWDTLYIHLDNGWSMYVHKTFLAPQSLFSKRIGPEIGWVFITPDGEHFTEFRCFTMRHLQTEKKLFLVREPTMFRVSSQKICDAFLNNINLKLDITIEKTTTSEKLWRFPSSLGMWAGEYNVGGSLSWSENEEDFNVDLNGHATSWVVSAAP
jgi:hypothetical protein